MNKLKISNEKINSKLMINTGPTNPSIIFIVIINEMLERSSQRALYSQRSTNNDRWIKNEVRIVVNEKNQINMENKTRTK
jgi:hypothetical protein